MPQLLFTAIAFMTHRNGGHTLNRFRQGWTTSETGGSGANLRNCAHAFFDTAAINAALVNKIPGQVYFRIPNTSSYGLTAGNYFRLHKSPFAYSETNDSHLDPHDYYPGGDFSNPDGTVVAGYVDSLSLVRNVATSTDVALPGDFLTHILSGKGIAAYNRTQVNSPTTSHYTRETNDPPVLIIEYTEATSTCGAPTSAAVATNISEGEVSVSWSGATPGINNIIVGYKFQYAESDDNGASWSEWSDLKEISTTAGSGSTTLAVAGTRSNLRKYQMLTIGSSGPEYYSSYMEIPGTVRRNALPGTLTVTAPVHLAGIHNTTPWIVASVGTEPDGQTQQLQVSIDGGVYATLANVIAAGGTVRAAMSGPLAIGVHNIALRVMDALGAAGPVINRTINVTATVFLRAINVGTIVYGSGAYHIPDIQELLVMINRIRAYYGLAAVALPGMLGQFRDWLPQMQALQAALGACYTAAGRSAPAWIVSSHNRPRADIINQLRATITAA